MSRGFTITALARRYLEHRRSLGYKLKDHDRRLQDFADYCDHKARGSAITTAIAVEWASLSKKGPAAMACRLSMVRLFATYCANLDRRTEVPQPHLLGRAAPRSRPHIFTHPEIVRVMLRARRLSDTNSPLRPKTYETLIGLLACTGMRPSEVLRLKLRDFDATNATLRVPAVKTSPERVIPLHPTAVAALNSYLELRWKTCPMGEHLFVGPIGRPLGRTSYGRVTQQLFRATKSNGVRRNVRPYDLRHSFASRLISQWSKEEVPVSHRLLLLTHYMGHSHFTQTWWYVSGCSDALHAAAKQFERYISEEEHDDL